MPIIKFSLNEEYYKKLVSDAEQTGSSIQDHIRNKLFDTETIFTPVEAIKRALNKYQSGETFTLPQLYAEEWLIPKGVAGVFGRNFYRYVQSQDGKVIFDKMVGGSRPIAQYKIKGEEL